MSETDQLTNDRIDMEQAAMHGHSESRQRLLDLGRSEHEVQRLENITNGFYDFARCVHEAEQWDQDKKD